MTPPATSSTSNVTASIADGIARVRLGRASVNALDEALIEELDESLDQVAKDPGVGALLIESTLPVFCAGADLKMLRQMIGEPGAGRNLRSYSARLQAVLAKVEHLAVPTVAVLSGAATGGGLELALACDLRVASPTARLGLPEVKVGLLPGAGGTQRLTRLIGGGAARRLILTGRLIDGQEAHALGIVEVVDEDVHAAAAALGEELTAVSAPAAQAAKRCMALAGTADGFVTELIESELLIETPECRERIEAFLNPVRKETS